ncbi:carboxymuconolactone decarboxylase family protein [Peribacillus sp. FSL E2-0159]|uniref:carboxymuconolactone decarboxylase family protein n=1 Tax=Peribacillus sp. FSL E2-0159 TaxID=2975289 RepID=UPI00315A9139
MKAGKLSVKEKEKEFIAIAIAHVTGCPNCIEAHVKGAKKTQVTKEEMAETISSNRIKSRFCYCSRH